MPSPFPGMDPYLESPHIWPDVHHKLINGIQDALTPVLRPHYVARVELRVYLSDADDPGRAAIIPDIKIDETKVKGKKLKATRNGGVALVEPEIIPYLIDDEIEEAYLEIRHRESKALVTIIEVLSATNKILGSRGRSSFLKKRHDALLDRINWVEIDLLRGGAATIPRKPSDESDYRILVWRGSNRSHARLWAFGVRQSIPPFVIPLRGKDPEAPLDLNPVFATAYENAAYDLSVDYRKNADPPLTGPDKTWAEKLLRERKLR